MTNLEFELLVSAARKRQDKILLVKGADYAEGIEDTSNRLSNFTHIATLLGIDQTTVCAIYLLKHVIALCRAVRDRELASEPLASRFDDVSNYTMLLLANFMETNPELLNGPSTVQEAAWESALPRIIAQTEELSHHDLRDQYA